MSDDFPKYWNDETGEVIEGEVYDNTSALMPIEETIPLPTISEQKDIVSSDPELSSESKGMLASLIEMNKVAQVLDTIRSTETQEMRKNVITHWAEAFIDARVRNNLVAENLKRALLERLLNNVENLDLDTASRILNDLHDVTNVDAAAAVSMINGGNGVTGNTGGGIQLTINNATSEGASITNNTLNTGGQPITQLKEVSSMNSSIKAWSNVPLPKRKTED